MHYQMLCLTKHRDTSYDDSPCFEAIQMAFVAQLSPAGPVQRFSLGQRGESRSVEAGRVGHGAPPQPDPGHGRELPARGDGAAARPGRRHQGERHREPVQQPPERVPAQRGDGEDKVKISLLARLSSGCSLPFIVY